MRIVILIILCFGYFLVPPNVPLVRPEEAPAVPWTSNEKESYSIGYQMGLSIRNGGIEVDLAHLVRGLQEAFDGSTPQLKPDDMRLIIGDLRKHARETALKRQQELVVRNAEESKRFLQENGQREGVRTTESGLQYKVLKAGQGATPKPEDRVLVNYRGTFIDGTEFDNSYKKGEPQAVQTDGVIKGWTEALQLMKEGSTWQVFVPPHLGYGRSGLEQKIPPNKVLVFEIELLSVGEKEAMKSGK